MDETPRRSRTDHRTPQSGAPLGAQLFARNHGNSINAILSAAALNFGKLLRFFLALLLSLLCTLIPKPPRLCLA